jgi:hypothetical protein
VSSLLFDRAAAMTCMSCWPEKFSQVIEGSTISLCSQDLIVRNYSSVGKVHRSGGFFRAHVNQNGQQLIQNCHGIRDAINLLIRGNFHDEVVGNTSLGAVQ